MTLPDFILIIAPCRVRTSARLKHGLACSGHRPGVLRNYSATGGLDIKVLDLDRCLAFRSTRGAVTVSLTTLTRRPHPGQPPRVVSEC